jgi:lipopolysaccharide/colanic/teichoic acid biosynthesis glycosyltransferase
MTVELADNSFAALDESPSMSTDTMQTAIPSRPVGPVGSTAPSSIDVEAPIYFRRKRVAVRILGGLMLIVAAPVILLLSLLIRATSRGPALFRQCRVGLDGKTFNILKLRTMRMDAEAGGGPQWCVPGDNRVTPVGNVLRLLHLDELPQLINVVRGEMDLIGPRPERPEIIESARLAEAVANYHRRHLILPGVTGLAQINLPADQTIDCVHRKVELDLEYMQTACLALDIRILACTLLRMFGIRHGIAVRMFGLGRPAAAQQTKRVVKPSRSRRRKQASGAAEFVGARISFATARVDQEDAANDDVIAALAQKRPR